MCVWGRGQLAVVENGSLAHFRCSLSIVWLCVLSAAGKKNRFGGEVVEFQTGL
jgi:hypothetical protein